MCAPHPNLARVTVYCPPFPQMTLRRSSEARTWLGADGPLGFRTSSSSSPSFSPAAAPPSPLRIVAHKELSVVMEISDCQTRGRGLPGAVGRGWRSLREQRWITRPLVLTPIRGTTNLRGFMFFTIRSCRGSLWDPPKPSKVMGNFSPTPHATPPRICRNRPRAVPLLGPLESSQRSRAGSRGIL